jgi:adenylate cyclase
VGSQHGIAPAGGQAVPDPVLDGLFAEGGPGSVRFHRATHFIAHTGVPLDAAPAVAVLPFTNMSPDRDQEYFADGMTEDLIRSVSRIEGVRVTPRTSVMRFKGRDRPIGEIARELGVAFVVEGSVRRDGNELRISASLIDAHRDALLWADAYDEELTGVFQLQSEITDQISRALEQRLSPADLARIAGGGTESLGAYDLLLRGREHLGRPGRADATKYVVAAEYFRRALEADPDYARAYAGLAERFRQDVHLPATPIRRDSILFYAGRAVELDPDLVEAVTELGYGHLYGQRWEEAEQSFRRALALDRSQADAMRGLSRLAALRGRLDD